MQSFPDKITSDDCFAVVRNSYHKNGAFHVVEYRLEWISGKPGYLGEYAHLVVTIQLKCKTQHVYKYFVKCMPSTDPKQREFVQECGIFTKEAHCYAKLFPKFEQDSAKVAKWRPECWLARDDLIVMEDLIDAGFRTMPFQRSFSKDHVLLTLDRIAQLHACSLDLEFNRMNGEKLENQFAEMLFEVTFTNENSWFVTGLKGVVEVALNGSKYSLDQRNKTIIQKQLLDKMERIYELTKAPSQFQSVIVHRDLWYNNLMFRFDRDGSGTINFEKPLDCLLLDFQLARYLPPATDFLCAIYLLTRRLDRIQFLDYYVQYYHKILSEKLLQLSLDIGKILPIEKFQESLEHYKLYGLVWSAVLRAFINLPEGFLHELHVNNPEAYHEFCFVSRTEVQMKFFTTDTFYRETLLDSIDEMLEYLFGFK